HPALKRAVAADRFQRKKGYNRDMGAMTAKVLFFGRLREIVGRGEDAFALTDGAPIDGIFAYYAERYPRLAEFRASVVASRNREFVDWETPVHSGDEIAFLPPVSGG
ncbi:MAG TPA: MoaD/ThiS family protein, partial [Candidatus Acidoferrum sp.]|nr:MoaD/ThiS family protein [Candidatus Acidoferrum sp.]